MAGDPRALDDQDIRLVLAAVADPVIASSFTNGIVYLDPNAERLLGWSGAELLGKPLELIVPERLRNVDGQRFHRRVVDASDPSRGGGLRAPVLRRDGVEINVEFSVGKAKLSSGELDVFCLRHLPESAELPTRESVEGSGLVSTTADVTQQETLRLIFENAPLGIFHFDARGVITACNDNFVDIIGSSRRVLVGLDLETLPDRGIVDSVRRSLQGHRAQYEGDYRSVTSGKITPVRASFAPVRSDDGRVLGGVGIVDDATERREAERALRRSEAAFRTLIEAAPDGIAVYRDGRLVFVNPAFVSELGYDAAAQLLGRRASDVVHPDYRERFEEHSRVMLASWQPIAPHEKQLLRRDGSGLWVEIATLPIDFDGKPAILLLSRDLSERKEMAARLAQADRMASVGTLAAGVAHEINNPLAYVLGSMDLCVRHLSGLRQLVGGESPARDLLRSLSECLGNARDGAERVRVIVRDLMTFSRAESTEPVAVDVESVLDASVSLVWNEIRHRARLVKSYGGVPAVLADEARLGQVFVNLLVNAAQSIPEGESRGSEIRIITSSAPDRVRVDIEDTGAGIPSDELGRIFEPFYTTKPVGAGTGLGLSICHGIISALGGSISAESEPGRGSRFHVELPVAPEQPPAESVEPSGPHGETAARILVIDDEPLLGQTLRLAFSQRHEVVVATSGREALSRLQQDTSFDLVLCDLMMPDISGIAVYEQVRSQMPELARRFVFMTGGAFTDRAREFLETYKGPHLEKPFDITQVEALLVRKR